MPPKAKIQAPIDRPLSRAYLREFTGWSTAYPPTLSDSTSLRVMENVQVNRDGSCRIRPGLRYISYEDDGAGVLKALKNQMVGTHETFFLDDGRKAYLFAVRESSGKVGFRMMQQEPFGMQVLPLTQQPFGFSVPQGEAQLEFSEATKYVKYLQIDNKIFALSDAGEPMRLFTVGTTKTAKVLSSIERPDWVVADKLQVLHPSSSWITSANPTGMRTNKVKYPSFEGSEGWLLYGQSELVRSNATAFTGQYSGRVNSTETTRNLVSAPLNNPAANGYTGWGVAGGGNPTLTAFSTGLRISSSASASSPGQENRMNSPQIPVEPNATYQVSFNLNAYDGYSNMVVRYVFYNGVAGQIGPAVEVAVGSVLTRKTPAAARAPTGAATMRVQFVGIRSSSSGWAENASFNISNVLVNYSGEGSSYFDGSSGGNYYWSGAAHNSQSVYHPPQDVSIYTEIDSVGSGGSWTASAHVRTGSTVRNAVLIVQWLNSAGALTGTSTGTVAADTAGFVRRTLTGTAPAGTARARLWVRFYAVPHSEYHYVDGVMFESGAAATAYFDGDTPDSGTLQYLWTGTAHKSTSTSATYAAPTVLPTAVSPKTANTLIAAPATPDKNVYNFGFFYNFGNEIGESSVSQVSVVRCQRAWPAWKWELPNAAGEPNGTSVTDPNLAADQLTAAIPSDVWLTALDQGATHWNLFMFTWSDQDPMPVTAVQIGRKEIKAGMTHAAHGWMRATPQMADISAESVPLPAESTRYNYSRPSCGGQGLIAGDRMILVADPTAAAVIRWTSNQQGHYTDFSATRGGGYKTLTSGNLFITSAAKLWQNPQSADTITVLNQGYDGYSNGYYMAPAQVASQSEAVNIMGFEETTATPGTVATYGNEVFNNSLYHPLDDQLMKSTASNYNINHKSQTDNIANQWRALNDKAKIVSAQYDGRLYFLVHNRTGAEIPPGCRGNEVWVFDGQAENGNWSRWLTPGHSLRKIGQGGQIAMSLMTPDGLFYFDETLDHDEYIHTDRSIQSRYIPWRLETNTQGANKAHDAWAHLQQLVMSLGNFQGKLRYGIHSWDYNGKPVEVSKIFNETHTVAPEHGPHQVEDQLQIRRDLKEWALFAESVIDPTTGLVEKSSGQINMVQYRYTPSTVNTGYEMGSIETFEYGRASAFPAAESNTDSGVPVPFNDHQHTRAR